MAEGRASADDTRFVGYRRKLIEDIRESGIHDLELLQLFDRVPRHLFVPEAMWSRAYDDEPVPIGFGQTASQPSLQAHMIAVLDPGPDDRVLEVGTGSGYLTALLAFRAERVYSVERVRELSARARRALDELRINNAALWVGDGTIGWRKYAPFQVIVVSAAAPSVPQALVDQLADPGRLLIPIGDRSIQELVLLRKKGGEVVQETLEGECAFVPLVGRFAWPEEA
ncbi:MAG TPA: protein-L-isoaspartate(D-aspartate) O-methyltransferase [Longimicrobiales bacterium]|jgi:protein-L-isoaspartate(D-aspartate) O-methyltransferase